MRTFPPGRNTAAIINERNLTGLTLRPGASLSIPKTDTNVAVHEVSDVFV